MSLKGYPKPQLKCSRDLMYEREPNRRTATIEIPKPISNVNWNQDITADPPWAKNITFELEIGVRNISFTARHPISKLTITCSFIITVLGR